MSARPTVYRWRYYYGAEQGALVCVTCGMELGKLLGDAPEGVAWELEVRETDERYLACSHQCADTFENSLPEVVS